MIKQQMVIVCPFISDVWGDYFDEIVFIRKTKPEWQAGKLNLPGGKIEPNETPVIAAVRELQEETALALKNITPVGHINNEDWIIYIFTGLVLDITDLFPGGETVELIPIQQALTHPDLINNLRYIIPECMKALDNFVLPNFTIKSVKRKVASINNHF